MVTVRVVRSASSAVRNDPTRVNSPLKRYETIHNHFMDLGPNYFDFEMSSPYLLMLVEANVCLK